MPKAKMGITAKARRRVGEDEEDETRGDIDIDEDMVGYEHT